MTYYIVKYGSELVSPTLVAGLACPILVVVVFVKTVIPILAAELVSPSLAVVRWLVYPSLVVVVCPNPVEPEYPSYCLSFELEHLVDYYLLLNIWLSRHLVVIS